MFLGRTFFFVLHKTVMNGSMESNSIDFPMVLLYIHNTYIDRKIQIDFSVKDLKGNDL